MNDCTFCNGEGTVIAITETNQENWHRSVVEELKLNPSNVDYYPCPMCEFIDKLYNNVEVN